MRSTFLVVAAWLAMFTLVGATRPALAASPVWTPQVAIVWPQDGQGNPTSVGQSRVVNISVWPSSQVSCSAPPRDIWQQPITLFSSRGNEPASPLGSGQLIQRTVNGVAFPSLEFNNIPVNIADDPSAQYRFFTLGEPPVGFGSGGMPSGSNVWVHAGDARTFLPDPVTPTGFSLASPSQLDTRVQIVWPHDEQGRPASPETARFVNVAVDIFDHGTLLSVPIDYRLPGPLMLLEGLGNLPLDSRAPGTRGRPIAQAKMSTYTTNGQTYPRWVFNDVPVSPNLPVHFVVFVNGIKTFPTAWTHAKDPRTILPNPPPPPPCQP